MIVQRLDRDVAQAALGPVDDALQGKIVVALRDDAQIRQRIAVFGAVVEAGAPDHAIGDTERQKAVFEFAHLERRAHQNGHLGKCLALPLQVFGFGGGIARFLLGVPEPLDLDLFARSSLSVHNVLPRRAAFAAIRPDAAPRIAGVDR